MAQLKKRALQMNDAQNVSRIPISWEAGKPFYLPARSACVGFAITFVEVESPLACGVLSCVVMARAGQ